MTQVFAQLRYNEVGLLALLGGSQVMIESPLIQELMASRMHKAILRVLTDKFGKVPAEVEQNLRAIVDEDRLDQLNSWAAQCPDLAAFAAHLP